MRAAWLALLGVVAAGCSGGGSAPSASGQPAAEPPPPQQPTPITPTTTAPWTFAVLSDLHLPNPKATVVAKTVAALIELRVRFVIVAGDHTNGSPTDPKGSHARAWAAVTDALRPLRSAGIGVLPVAGNHDSYLDWQREGYRRAFADLASWAAPLTVNRPTGRGLAQPPFSYSIDVDGIHLALAHIVNQRLDRDVAGWLADDLASASTARRRIIVGHVPVVSVIRPPAERLIDELGGQLARGRADLYIAGHEHVSWDETFTLDGGATLREVIVGCSSGFYDYEPSATSKQRARCEPVGHDPRSRQRCRMPNGGWFELARGRKNRLVQHDLNTFALFTVIGDEVVVEPMTVDSNGRARAFYLAER